MESMRDTKRIMEREIKKGSTPLQFERIELDAGCYQEIASKEKLTEVLQYLHRVGEYKASVIMILPDCKEICSPVNLNDGARPMWAE